jgi:transposase
LEKRRRLAAQRVTEGWKQKDVAEFLGVAARTVSRWMAAHRAGGEAALAAKPTPGRPPKLTARRERSVLSWLEGSPRAFGYTSDLWTTRRLAEAIEERFKVRFNPNYLAAWLTARGLSPQRPEVRAVERDEPAIARWVVEDWPRIKKRPPRGGRTSS